MAMREIPTVGVRPCLAQFFLLGALFALAGEENLLYSKRQTGMMLSRQLTGDGFAAVDPNQQRSRGSSFEFSAPTQHTMGGGTVTPNATGVLRLSTGAPSQFAGQPASQLVGQPAAAAQPAVPLGSGGGVRMPHQQGGGPGRSTLGPQPVGLHMTGDKAAAVPPPQPAGSGQLVEALLDSFSGAPSAYVWISSM